MNKSLIMLSLLLSTTLPAWAVDGTINFTGAITDTACKVDGASANQNVTLGTVASSGFSGAGSVAAPTKFSIILTDCPASATTAQVSFDGNTSGTNPTLLSLGSGQTASNVGVAIYEEDGTTQIPVGVHSKAWNLSAKNANTLNYIAKYMATASTVGQGTANATTSFTVVYN